MKKKVNPAEEICKSFIPHPIPVNGIRSVEQLGETFNKGYGKPLKNAIDANTKMDNNCPINQFLKKIIILDDDDLSQEEKNLIETFIFFWMTGFIPIEVSYEAFRTWTIKNTEHPDKNDPLFVEVMNIIESRFKMIGEDHAKVFSVFVQNDEYETESDVNQ